LEKARLEDDLSKKLASRPVPEELIKEKILQRMYLNYRALIADVSLADEDPTKEPEE